MEMSAVLKVLLVAPENEESGYWDDLTDGQLDVRREPTLAAAARRIDAGQVDALVVDATLARSNELAVQRLRENNWLPMFLVADRPDAEIADLAQRLNAEEFLSAGSAARSLHGRVVRLTAERARLQTELAQSRARFRDVIEHNADAIVVVDRNGLIQFANRMAVRWFDSTAERLVGTEFGFPVVAGETTELDIVTNGTARVVEMRVVESAWEGRPAFIASLRDITDRKRAEESARGLIREQAARAAAEKSAQRFRFLAECSSVLGTSLDYNVTLSALTRLCVAQLADWTVIYVVDDDGDVRRLEVAHRDPNKTELTALIRDYPLAPDSSNPVFKVITSRIPVLAQQVDDEALRAIARDDTHFELMRSLGVGSFMLVPLLARDRVVGAIALVSGNPEYAFDQDDLTLAQDIAVRAALAIDNARLYQQAQEANRTKAEFLAVLSHDMRTPLASIIGYSELLYMGIPERIPEISRERVDRIGTAARHLLYLIDQLLMFARLDAHYDEPSIQEVDIAALVTDVSALIEPIAEQHNLRFDVMVSDRELCIYTDPDKLRQILVNLLGNAVKYTASGTVQLRVNKDDSQDTVFEVHDTGIGIPAEHLEKIFEPFWQADPTMRARPGGGTGLGLSVVQRLVKALRGDIAVTSKPGQGTTFLLRLPNRPSTEAQKSI
jgi:PAS domain S-box-containing protein